MKEIKIDIFGRVQGVRFRHFVKKHADAMGLKGFVRNRPDGSVLVVAQGSSKELEDFLFRVQRGPLIAKVTGVSYVWRKPVQSYSDFTIEVEGDFVRDQASSFTNLGRFFLSKKRAPRHIAIIPDGNRRWARERGLAVSKGHQNAVQEQKVMDLFREARSLGVKYVSLWGFSTENWKRSKEEVDQLFDLFRKELGVIETTFVREKIRFRHVGRRDRLPEDIIRALEDFEAKTKDFRDFNVQFCLDYGGRDELARAVNKIIQSGVREVSESDFAKFLDTDDIPDPDLIIRTSGEQRTSGFMPYQSTYAELYFSPLYFPEFGPLQLREAVQEFIRRKRNFGS